MFRAGDLQNSGITRNSLEESWVTIRKAIRDVYRRDSFDFIEYDIAPTKWIKLLLRDIQEGTYQPAVPTHFKIAKSNGFKRIVTRPSIPDAVLYRTVVDGLLEPFKKYQVRHAYFARAELSKLQEEIAQQLANKAPKDSGDDDDDDENYGDKFSNRFLIRPFKTWKEFSQYRKYLIFEDVHPYIINTDITNFFDSILHSQIQKTLSDISVPRVVIELLLLLLERLSPKAPLSPNAAIGLPVEEFGCSRALAHMVLFPHDRRIVAEVGEDNYVRWMDDQNLGAKSRAHALQLIGKIQHSLTLLHLTPNSGKTKILTIEQASAHFHLGTNAELDELEGLPSTTPEARRKLRRGLISVWRVARLREGNGEFSKILKRLYRFAALSDSRLFVHRALRDILGHPEDAPRIIEYARVVLPAASFVMFCINVLEHELQVYEDVSVAVCESLLRSEPGAAESRLLLRLAVNIYEGKSSICGAADCAPLAPLFFLRYGDGRTLRRLERSLRNDSAQLRPAVLRGIALVLMGVSQSKLELVRDYSAKSPRNVLSELIRMADQVLRFRKVPHGRFSERTKLFFDPLQRRHALDLRALATLRLLALNSELPVQVWIRQRIAQFISKGISDFERRLLRRLFPKALTADPE